MFDKLQQCTNKDIFIKYWKDGTLNFYEGVLTKVVDYKYILVDRQNFLLFYAINGAIASIKCAGDIVYQSVYDDKGYDTIDVVEELEKRELAGFDDVFRKMKYESSLEYFLKRGKELLTDSYYARWEEFVKANIEKRLHIVKGIIDIVNKVQSGMSYYKSLIEVLGDSFAFSVLEMEEINDIIVEIFADTVYEYTDYAEYMLHYVGIKRLEEKQNMKQLMNSHNVFISLEK
ncbi:MAG: hypothetical protein OSJ70_06840 [Bacilli bacterium]|nr:hypothetical protein [Bacilli bacterium]